MNDLTSRLAIAGTCMDIRSYDVIFIGFPIWWYIAPTIVNTFLESYDLSGKTVIPFATSGGSSMGQTNEKLLDSCKGAHLMEGKVLFQAASDAELKAFAMEYHVL